VASEALAPFRWEDGTLCLLDQRRLPQEEAWLELDDWREVLGAIRDMAVRGAPAIGVAAAYGVVLAARQRQLAEALPALAGARPTAVNLAWAVRRMAALGTEDPGALLAEAQAIEAEDRAMNQAIGRHGAALLPERCRLLTICNTGALATAGHGTALGIVRTARDQGKLQTVVACETRPRLQGLRLTAWELLREGIPFRAVPDSAAAGLLAQGGADAVVVGADRIAANGDTANKVGTLALAVLAHHYGVPFYVAAPSSTLDPATPDGSAIPIEERAPEEVTEIEGVRVAPQGCPVWNPGFDVTPGALVGAIVTELGVHRPPYRF
jgi:methylthioribose-1-phosphate isomerase